MHLSSEKKKLQVEGSTRAYASPTSQSIPPLLLIHRFNALRE
ncbi:unnamed protein product [Rhodiola kirilowii]